MPITKITQEKAAFEFQPTLDATDDLIRLLLDDGDDYLANAVFFSKLTQLRREHKKSLKIMQDLYKEKNVQRRRSQSLRARPCGHEQSERPQNVVSKTPDSQLGRSREGRNGNFESDSDDEFSNFKAREIYLKDFQSDEDDIRSMDGSYISDSYFPQDWEHGALGSYRNDFDDREMGIHFQNEAHKTLKVSFKGAFLGKQETEKVKGPKRDGDHLYGKNGTYKYPHDGEDSHIGAQLYSQEGSQLGPTDYPHHVTPDPREWTPKITIPVPFNMSIRDETNPIKASYSQNFLKQLKKEQESKEAEFLKAQFRARPAPPSTHLPLYEELRKKNQERRHFLREYSKEILKEKLKPFHGKTFDGLRHKRRCKSLIDFSDHDRIDQNFKARPVPDHVINGATDNEIKRRERERQEKRIRRAEELLRNSKLPANMQAMTSSNIKQAWQSRRKHQNTCQNDALTFKPQIIGKVPDFAALHDQFQKILGDAKLKGSKVTIPEPFELRINSNQRKGHHHEEHKAFVKKHHNDARLSRSMTNLDQLDNRRIIAKANTAALLREAAAKRLLNEANAKNFQRYPQNEIEEAQMREQIRSKLIDYDLIRRSKERQRAEQRRTANESSQALFEQFKRAISEKISSRESLLDRQNTLVAKQSIEKRYRKALEAAGLKGVSVDTAMFSIGKFLSQDKEAAETVANILEQEDSKSTVSSQSSVSSRSEQSEDSHSGSGKSKSDKTITVLSRTPTGSTNSSGESESEDDNSKRIKDNMFEV